MFSKMDKRVKPLNRLISSKELDDEVDDEPDQSEDAEAGTSQEAITMSEPHPS